ncbi:septum formation protein Maf [Enterococcus sp. DIV2402]|uniref:dTTP/UTP pyrophosphatase n=1 Tax=Candidatus Enterococcus lowellii TaxID=2230877 RepID=A0ABZ2SK00_9ENTE|nr:Maf family protein [Enterococcus sp. DIV2402]MBO0465410.1 septum formation protein Maf [Enterococcus sp. DIV2402]
MNVILASQSPRRKELLRLLLDDFEVIPADIDETIGVHDEPEEYVLRMAQEKAAFITQHYPEALVIASDTIVVSEGEILGKPTSREDAQRMLIQMSGKTHIVYTSVVLSTNKKRFEQISSAKVSFFDLSEEEISDYLDKQEYMDKAGAYGIQGAAAIFVQEIQGDYYAIVGFPVGLVHQLLKEFST